MAARGLRPQGLTEGAILAALVALLAVAARYFPPLAFVAQYLCPVPLAILVIRHGFRVAAIASVVSVLIGTMLAGPLVGLAILVAIAPMGLVIGLGARRQWGTTRIIVLAAVVSLVSLVFSFGGLLANGPEGIAGMMREMGATMERSIEMSAGFYARLGVPKEAQEQNARQLREFIRLLPYVFPGILGMAALVAAWTNYEVSRRVMQRFGYRLPALPPMREWRVPSWVAWILPAGLAALLVSQRVGRSAVLETVGQSLMLVAVSAFSINGLIAIWVILGNMELSTRERTIAAVFIFLLSTAVPILSMLLLGIGLLDAFYRVRETWGRSKSGARRSES